MKNTLAKFTNNDLHKFILGCVEFYQLNDYIDLRKYPEFIVSNDGFKFHVKYIWFTGVKYNKSLDPRIGENTWQTNDNYFSVLLSDSPQKLAKEVLDAIEVINQNEFNED